jgi:hypothetical protein
MQVFTYDLCLLLTYDGPDTFGITKMQTDDTLSFTTAKFSAREKKELRQAKLCAKQKETLSPDYLIKFNGRKISSYG